MANTSDYVKQLEEVRKTRIASDRASRNDALVYQSRSGAPGQPWLEPDILDYLREVKPKNLASAVVVAPISFISDHMEVLYDLDIEARQLCERLALPMARAKTVGVHPKFIAMIRELILERTEGVRTARAGIARSAPGCLRGRLLPRAATSSAPAKCPTLIVPTLIRMSAPRRLWTFVIRCFRAALNQMHRIEDRLDRPVRCPPRCSSSCDRAIASASRH